MPIEYPLINGHRYDFSFIEMSIRRAGAPLLKRTLGLKELSYQQSLEPGIVRGNSAQVIGRTRGEHNSEGSLTLYRLEYEELIAVLGNGYMEVPFDIEVAYGDPGRPTSMDALIGCRIKSEDQSHSEGNEALVVKADLHIMRIILAGRSALANPLK